MWPPPVTLSEHEPGPGPGPGPGPASDAQARTAVPVIVAPAFAKALPLWVPRVCSIAAPARIVPARFESVIVAAWAVHHVTLHAWAPPAITTEKLVPVRAPVGSAGGVASADPTLKVQVALGGPSSVNTPVSAAAAGKQ